MRSLAVVASLAFAGPALAQPADPHAGHSMPAPPARPADPHAGHSISAQPPAADPHAGHRAPAAPPADPHAAHRAPAQPADPHAGHTTAAASPVGDEPPPPVPTDHAADRVFSRADMVRGREILRREHGDVRWSLVMAEKLEFRPADDSFAWEGRASYGGDINRVVLKTEGEFASGHVHEAEVQALYSRAVTPYFNLQAGVRQDIQPRPRRTYATIGVDGLAPYWFDVEGALFLSNKGDISARLEGAFDWRLTQKLILERRIEANLAAEDVPELGVGSGLTDLELGLRLRYALTPEFAPYVGVEWERKFGDTADFARAAGEDVRDTRIVFGIRAWF